MIGTVNVMLNKQVGGEQMATGGTYRRVTSNISLICGFYFDTRRAPDTAPPSAYAILLDKGTNSFTTFAPITHAQQEAKGCWPDERARMKRELEEFNRLVQGGKR